MEDTRWEKLGKRYQAIFGVYLVACLYFWYPYARANEPTTEPTALIGLLLFATALGAGFCEWMIIAPFYPRSYGEVDDPSRGRFLYNLLNIGRYLFLSPFYLIGYSLVFGIILLALLTSRLEHRPFDDVVKEWGAGLRKLGEPKPA